MEAAEALGRGGRLSTLLEAGRGAVLARSRAFWIVAGLTVAAAALRFATLGVQSYHHDEIVTASRILRDGFWHAMSAVDFSESAPPLYYALAWVWTQLTGTGELGLRSISALAGVATVPVAYLLGVELRGRRAGIAAAALVAVNPMLLWYSQEARAYSLFALLTAVSILYFVRALDRGRRHDFTCWGIVSALALATHYFAIFPIAAEALWLLRRRGRAAVAGLWIVALAGLALAPLAIHQMSIGHAEWIGNYPLAHRLWEAAVTFTAGETGDVIARPERPLAGLLPLALIVAALALLLARGDRSERRRAGIALAIGAVTVAVPLALALISPSKDYVLARNLLPALVPLLVAVAIAVTLRGARRSGALLGILLVAYSFGFCVWASVSPALQRPDWDAIANRLGEPAAPRAMVTWTLGEASLRYYLSTGSFQVSPSEGLDWLVGEVDLISNGPAPPPPARLLGPGFREASYEQVGRLYIRRYTVIGPGLKPLRLREVRDARLGFRTNGVLLDGIGPG
jgi:4-amino-4-deoxy-L-arabinose transferase-like glycosyltransferase